MDFEVPFLPLVEGYKELEVDFLGAAKRVFSSGRYILGEEVNAFEFAYAQHSRVSGCVGVGNGLDALIFALRALNIGPGDEVIVPAHTFIATWLAVSAVGASIIPVDIEPLTYGLDPEKVESAITPKTKALIVVHLYGQLAQIEKIVDLAKSYGLFVIEDAAQSQGANANGVYAGGFGDVGATSFYPGKNLGAFGDAGAVTSNNQELLQTVRSLRNYGSRIKYQHELMGANSRLDEMQAAFLSIKLRVLDDWNRRRADVANRYLKQLADIDHELLKLPSVSENSRHVWHLFVVLVPNRDRFIKSMGDMGIECGIHYPKPCHKQIAYETFQAKRFDVAESVSASCVSLPISPFLSESQVQSVIRATRRALA